MPTLYIAGAGCSLGTLDHSNDIRPPVAAEFVKELERRKWIDDYRELAKTIQHLRKTHRHVGLEELWTCIDLHAKFESAFPIAWSPRGPVVSELKSAIVRMYGSCCEQFSKSIASSDCCTVVRDVAKKIEAGDTLVSFNYDTIIEQVVSTTGNVRLRHGKDLKPGTIRFAKPHGSTSWRLSYLPYALTDGNPILESLSYEDVKTGREDPLLLGAVPLKSELIWEVSKYYGSPRIFEVVREQWQTLANAVATATRIVILGYSFPKEDMYGRFFLNEGKALRGAELSLSIDIFSVSPETVTPVADLFPDGTAIRFMGPVTPASSGA